MQSHSFYCIGPMFQLMTLPKMLSPHIPILMQLSIFKLMHTSIFLTALMMIVLKEEVHFQFLSPRENDSTWITLQPRISTLRIPKNDHQSIEDHFNALKTSSYGH